MKGICGECYKEIESKDFVIVPSQRTFGEYTFLVCDECYRKKYRENFSKMHLKERCD